MIEILEGTKETVNFKDGSVIKLHNNDEAEDYPMHWHLPIEIIMPVNNYYDIKCVDAHYHLRQWDILFVQPGVLHECIAPSYGRRFFCQASLFPLVSAKLYTALNLIIPPVMLITPELDPEMHAQIKTLLLQIYETEIGFTVMEDFTKYLRILQITHLAYSYFEKNAQTEKLETVGKQESILLVQQSCAYIREHFAEALTLEEVAKTVGFSKFYFTRLFKFCTGDTFYQYLNRVRMSNAQVMLTEPGISITDVAYSVGYTSISSFIRMFRNFYDCTPSDFRRMFEHK